MNHKSNMIIPLIASIGIGCATYYSMRHNGNFHPFQQMSQMMKGSMK
ncbi:hypothetical protein SAMN04488134_101595 [Amphibacillus marinus]|uniref:Lipoprotein n=1 Tax=Amphibacillus marinus TaxID=872970 RepID=A0A1H8IER0_9BACI|nr:hypothetical protein [Amphibacillus marinus]SEN66739.1 hypothetical protein SAMN04488134_101595 [Amphibacillus marinus]